MCKKKKCKFLAIFFKSSYKWQITTVWFLNSRYYKKHTKNKKSYEIPIIIKIQQSYE